MGKKSLTNEKIPEIDVIRCVAIIQIVLFHMCVSEEPFANALILWGREGSGLFFAISGAGLINRYYYDFDCKSYFKKRFISIYIPFWIAYVAAFVRNYFINGFHFPWEHSGISKKYMLLSLLGVDGFASAVGIPNFALIGEWFLAVILFIYLIFPIWRKLFIKLPELTVILFLIARVIMCLHNPIPRLAVCFNPITALSNFSIGAYLLPFRSKRHINPNKTLNQSNAMAISVSIALIVFGKHLTLRREQADIGEIFATVGLLLILVTVSPAVTKYANKFVKFICDRSYEIILVHHIVIYATTTVIHNNFTVSNAIVGYGYTLSVILLFACALNSVSRPIANFLSNLKFYSPDQMSQN